MESSLGIALVLAAYTFIASYDYLGPKFLNLFHPLFSGFFTGLIIGDLGSGLIVGASLELMMLGIYFIGNARIPNYFIASILGTYFAKTSGIEVGLTLALPAALLLTNLDVLGFIFNGIIGNRVGQKAVEENKPGKFERVVFFLPAINCSLNAIAVFIAVYLGNSVIDAMNQFFTAYPWINSGVQAMAGVLPSLGFAMMLLFLPVKKYWYFLLLGFVLFNFLNMSILGIVCISIVVTVVFFKLKDKEAALV